MRRRAGYSIINKKGCESDCSHILFCCLRRRDYSQFRGGTGGATLPLEERYVPPHFHKDYSRGGSWRHSVHKGYFGEPGTTQVYQS